jgi:3-dehydroquinate synthase
MPHLLPFIDKTKRIFIVTDAHLARHHLAALMALFEAHGYGENTYPLVVEAGEASKSFEVLETLLHDMIIAGADRESLLIAFGGGVVGDAAGFASACLLRGVEYIHIPTSLLAQVDSAIGGKTGINLSIGKNLVGAFHHPRAVLIDLAFLKTLPKREMAAGYAEIVKYGLITQADFFDWLEGIDDDILEVGENYTLLQQAVFRSYSIKADIVMQDEKEEGRRAILNLGHSFGHAIETYLGYDGRILHGEAVALGTVLAFTLAEKLLDCPHNDTKRIIAHYQRHLLPVALNEVAGLEKWNAEAMVNLMMYDKKNRGGTLTLILPKCIGEVSICKGIDKNTMIEALMPFFKKMNSTHA